MLFSLLVSVNCLGFFFYQFSFFKSETTTFEPEVHSEKTTNTSKQEKLNKGRLLIILAGSVVSLSLFLIIIHELYTYRHISNPIGVLHVANDVYEDIAASNDEIVLRCV